jgi:hypothetical protein
VALERQLAKRARVLPVLVRPCTPTGFLSTLAWLDFTEDYDVALAHLIWGITGERPKAAKGEQPGIPTNPRSRCGRQPSPRSSSSCRTLQIKGGRSLPSQQGAAASPRLEGKNRCFIIMPFGDKDLEVVYDARSTEHTSGTPLAREGQVLRGS